MRIIRVWFEHIPNRGKIAAAQMRSLIPGDTNKIGIRLIVGDGKIEEVGFGKIVFYQLIAFVTQSGRIVRLVVAPVHILRQGCKPQVVKPVAVYLVREDTRIIYDQSDALERTVGLVKLVILHVVAGTLVEIQTVAIYRTGLSVPEGIA